MSWSYNYTITQFDWPRLTDLMRTSIQLELQNIVDTRTPVSTEMPTIFNSQTSSTCLGAAVNRTAAALESYPYPFIAPNPQSGRKFA